MKAFKILISALAIYMTGTAVAQAQSYSPEAIDILRYMIEEEKLAGDVYRSLGALYPTIMPFKNIPRSEDTHVTALVGQANAIGLNISDLTSLPAGQFQNPALQSLYQNLVAQGSASSFAALTVGKNIELLDIADLTAARALIPMDSNLYTTYGSLMNASNNHLRAFNSWLAVTPAPPVPEPESYAMLLAGLAIVGGVARRNQRAMN
ncbi:ferritin-like domain-containing protein [Ferribacterium limneticum]|uniref:ferritin-like domain-containing protein n=1 Tax=Ferribacterium limneticum TaxID=76259 RepID=UPI001CF8D979|nr:DUF2202 domain-containing protein [Ferribacterium limneticum]UCV21928.1 DUF2202 domain-containing protein [Ferribacterium limneticum]